MELVNKSMYMCVCTNVHFGSQSQQVLPLCRFSYILVAKDVQEEDEGGDDENGQH